MQQVILDETVIIDKIRQYAQDIFDIDNDESEISLTISQSQYHIEQRLQPFIKSIKASKKQHKRGIKHIYSTHYSQYHSYTSPYSKKQTSERLSTSRTIHNQKKANNSMRKKIFSFYDQQKQIQDQKQKTKRLSQHKKYENLKPRYLEKEPIVKNLSAYIQKNVYGRLKTEAQHLRRVSPMSKQQSEAKWDSFLKKNNEWDQARENSLIKARISSKMKVSHQLHTRPPRKSPPKMTVDDCLQKLRRQAEKLRQKLNQYSFQPKLYESQRRKHKLSKQKSKIREGHSSSPSPEKYEIDDNRQKIANPQKYQRNQRRFTIISNPKKELDFILK